MTKAARIRQKTCHHCAIFSQALYRVQLEVNLDWVFLCPNCRTKAELEFNGYRYGGTWKARKRH